MECAGCQQHNDETAQYCIGCGAPLRRVCACGRANSPAVLSCSACTADLLRGCGECGAANALTARFCAVCGTALGSSADPDTQLDLSFVVPEAERRQVTVMFCDLVGSTPLSEQLDPEELREVLGLYQELCAEVISGLEGYIARYFGDGLLVYFGYPRAYGDDAARAVRSGLGILEAMGELNPHLHEERGITLDLRIGVHTGLVVAGDIARGGQFESMAIVGDTPNVAARLQGLAEPNTVVVSAVTRELVGTAFNCRALGVHALRGISEPVEVHSVASERTECPAPGSGVTPLVGRRAELEQLAQHWRQVGRRRGGVVLLSGEAGIGKTRLAAAFKEQVGRRGWILECSGSAYNRHSALHPVLEMFGRTVFRFGQDDGPARRARKLEVGLRRSGLATSAALSLLAALYSLPVKNAAAAVAPEQQRERALDLLFQIVRRGARRRPALLLVEDLHLVDTSSLEWFGRVVEGAEKAPIYIFFTSRSDFDPSWTERSHVERIDLERLQKPEVADLVAEMTGGKALPSEVFDQIAARADGVPLFVEELTRTVLESEWLQEEEHFYALTAPLPALAIPPTLQDSLMARLDRLGEAREVAQLGAILGREFPYEVIEAVFPSGGEVLRRGLAHLVEAELLDQAGEPPAATYAFRQNLMQEAAYQSLLRNTRQHYHENIARVLEQRFVEERPELLAYHCAQAGLDEEAIGWWLRAGKRALERSAPAAAVAHLQEGLELLRRAPEDEARERCELELQIVLGPALIATQGWAAPEVERSYGRARDLCGRLDQEPTFPVLWGLFGVHFVQAELETARVLAEELLGLAQEGGDAAELVEAHHLLGGALYCLGDLAAAQEHLEYSVVLYDAAQQGAHAAHFGMDFGVSSMSWLGHALWLLGYPDQALGWCQEAMMQARTCSQLFSRALALNYAAMLQQFRGARQLVLEHAEQARILCAEQGFAYYQAWATFMQGCAVGQSEKGVEQMREGLDALLGTGAGLRQPYYLALMAQVCGASGASEEALDLLSRGQEIVEQTQERMWEAELHRVRGELLLMSGREHQVEAESCFFAALDVARGQEARSLELRAALSLAQLWKKQGSRDGARELLAEVYEWFTEGFDTADLKAARTLLDELEE